MTIPLDNVAALAKVELFMQCGMLSEAEMLCREILGQTPAEGRAWMHWGLIRLVQGSLVDGEYGLRQAVAMNPAQNDAWNNLSAVLFQRGILDEAAACARESLKWGNHSAAPWVNLGHIAVARKDWRSAAEVYRNAVAIDAGNIAAWSNLATCEQELGNWSAAQAAFERSLLLAPHDLAVRANFGWFLTNRGQASRAVEVLAPVLVDRVEAVAAWTAAGHARSKLGDRTGAEAAYRIALKHAPKNAFARHGLAMVLRLNWRLAEAEGLIRELLADEPNFSPAWVLLAGMQSEGAARESFRRAIAINPKPGTHSALLLSMQYAADADVEGLLAAHREWEANYARALMPVSPPVASGKRVGERLRLGFVSAGFCRHPVGFLGLPALERLDREWCEIVCYSDSLVEDEFTTRFKAAATKWRRTVGLGNDEVAEMVTQDGIDVLFDLGGHTEDRLLLFARKPAALQVSWLGYVGTTGLAAMDCLLADRFHVRPGEEGRYIERILRMPNDYVCYEPVADAPDVAVLPALANGYLTFGSFNNPAKFSSLTLDVWAEVLRGVPRSRLLLKYGGLDQLEVQTHLRSALATKGIEGGRILFEGWSEPRELLGAYGRVDLGLDTLPYSGGLTTCEALWMGVPVITYPGKTFASRHSTSHLMNAGLSEFVAEDREGYVRLAVEWGGRARELAELRGRLREQLRSSALGDGEAFAGDFRSILEGEWSRRSVKTG